MQQSARGILYLFGFAGALALSFLVHLAVALLSPATLSDGQYGWLFWGLFPLGWLFGSALGLRIARSKGWITASLSEKEESSQLYGGCLLAALLGIVAAPVVGMGVARLVDSLLGLFR